MGRKTFLINIKHFFFGFKESATCVKVRLHWARSNAKRRLVTFASGRLRYLFKTGQPFKNNFVYNEVKQPLAKFATSWNLSQVVDEVKFWLGPVRCKRTFTKQ